MSRPPTLIVAGGGTGGHVLAGIAVADAWRARFADGRVVFVGAQGGIEEKLVPRAGYPLERLQLGSLKRVSWSRRMKTAFQLPWSILVSAAILFREKPRAVIGVGGYASGPLVLMARALGWMFGSRVAILEQNAVPGFTNRILARVVHRVMLAFPSMEFRLPKKKSIVTGNPVRAAIQPFAAASREPFVIFVFGGSQGALGINTLVLESIPLIRDLLPRIHFVHQTGEVDFARVRDGHLNLGTHARVEKFIYEMPEVYAQSSLVICRAGSSTLAELAAVGRAAVLIPFPYASDNHQEKNARIFEAVGGARLLKQFVAQPADLAATIRELIERPEQISAMEKAVSAFYRPQAAADIVDALVTP